MKLKLIKLTLVLLGFSFSSLAIVGCGANHSGDPYSAARAEGPGSEFIFPIPGGSNPGDPFVPGNPGTPEIPGNPGNPGTPDNPGNPGAPGTPGVPGSSPLVPGAPETPADNVVTVVGGVDYLLCQKGGITQIDAAVLAARFQQALAVSNASGQPIDLLTSTQAYCDRAAVADCAPALARAAQITRLISQLRAKCADLCPMESAKQFEQLVLKSFKYRAALEGTSPGLGCGQ